MKFWGASLSLLTLFASQPWLAAQAAAQEAGAFRRDRNIPVRDRERPEYDAQGVHMGGFFFFPEASVGIESNSNVFADDTFEESDLLTTAELAGELRSNWNTHELNLSAAVKGRSYQEFSEQDAIDWRLGAETRIDASRLFYIFAHADYENAHEDLSSSPTTSLLAEPVPYTALNAELGVQKTFNRVRVTLSGQGEQYDYGDADLQGGGTLLGDERDFRETAVLGRIDYALSPGTAMFLSGRAYERDFDLDPPSPVAPVDRDATGYEVLAGVNFDLTNLMTGELGVGYLQEEYDEPGAEEVSGVAVRGAINWFPDELWTVGLELERKTEPPGAPGALGFVRSSAQLHADYEFRRNIIFGISGGLERDEYEGIDREDQRNSFAATADYAPNRALTFSLSAGHYEQESEGAAPGRDYTIDRVTFGVTLRR